MVAEEAPVEHTSREEAELRSCEQELAELEAEHQCTAERSQALVRNIDALGGRERELAQELAEISVLITLTRAVASRGRPDAAGHAEEQETAIANGGEKCEESKCVSGRVEQDSAPNTAGGRLVH